MDYIRLEIDINNRFNSEGLYEMEHNTPKWSELYLSDDTEIEMDVYSPLFNKKDETRSLPFKVSTKANSWLFGNSELMNGESIFSVLQNRPFRLWAGGCVFMSGIVKLDKEVELDNGEMDIELRGNQKSFDEMIESIKARDVEIYNHPKYPERNTQIGWCMGDEMKFTFYMDVTRTRPNGVAGHNWPVWDWDTAESEYQKDVYIALPSNMVPYYVKDDGSHSEDYTNSTSPYPIKRFCNIRICFPRFEETNPKDAPGTYESVRGYHVADASRTHTSPCFFVLWWIELLMQDLGIAITRNDMYKEPDLLRLAFAHTDCKYTAGTNTYGEFVNSINKKDTIISVTINEKLAYHVKCETRKIQYIYPIDGHRGEIFPDFEARDLHMDETAMGPIDGHTVDAYFVKTQSAYIPRIHKAYATSDNFPDEKAKDIIEAIEAGFNLRFMYFAETNSMEIVFVDDILAQHGYEEVPCTISKRYKSETETRGFRLKYKASSEISKNPLTKAKRFTQGDDDTVYNYYDFRKVEVMSDYESLFPKIDPSNNTLYINRFTGDAFRIKNDKEAKGNETILYPSLFEVNGFHDVEVGDCSNSDTTEEVSIGFSPVFVNDTNFEDERDATYADDSDDGDGIVKPSFSVYADCEIHTSKSDSKGKQTNKLVKESEKWTKVIIQQRGYNDRVGTKLGNTFVTSDITLEQESTESYDPSQDHPYDGVDFGFTLGILRDTDSSDGLRYFNENYDKRDNKEWMLTTKGNGDFTSDSIDQYGNELCSHGKAETITVNKSNAAAFIRSYFPDSNANLVSAGRKVSARVMLEAGYADFTGDYATYFSTSFGLEDKDGRVKEFLVTPITDSGNVMSSDVLREYTRLLEQQAKVLNASIMTIDRFMQKVFIAVYEESSTADMYADLLHKLGEVYYGDSDADVKIETPNIIERHIGMSLKLQAEKFNPDSKDKAGNSHADYPYPISSSCAKRGLYDRRYVNYAYFVTHRKEAHIEFVQGGLEAAVIRNFDFLKKYKIGEDVGFLNRVHYKIGKKTGLTDVSVEMYYI